MYADTIEQGLQGLNPYSTGRYSMSTSTISEVIAAIVLILIILEDTLRVKKNIQKET